MHICHKYNAACVMDVQFYIYICVRFCLSILNLFPIVFREHVILYL